MVPNLEEFSANQDVGKINGQNATWLTPQLRMAQVHSSALPHQSVTDSDLGALEAPRIKVRQSPKLPFLMIEILVINAFLEPDLMATSSWLFLHFYPSPNLQNSSVSSECEKNCLSLKSHNTPHREPCGTYWSSHDGYVNTQSSLRTFPG